MSGAGCAFLAGVLILIVAGLAGVDWLGYLALAAWAVPTVLGITAALLSVTPVLPFGGARRQALQWMLIAAAVIPAIPWALLIYLDFMDRGPSAGDLAWLLFFPFFLSPAICFLVPISRIRRDGYPRAVQLLPAAPVLPPAVLQQAAPAGPTSPTGALGPTRQVLRMTAFAGSSVWQALVRAEKEEPPAQAAARGIAALLGQPSAPDMSTGVDVVIAERGLAIHRSESEWHRAIFGNLPFPDLQLTWTDIHSVEKVRAGHRLKLEVSGCPFPVFNLSTLSKKTLQELIDALESHGVEVHGHTPSRTPIGRSTVA